MNILMVKLSSMGDLIQAFPAISELSRHYPQAKIDWLVDESFSEIPSWHSNINRVYTTAHRRWKNNLFSKLTWTEIRELRRSLHKTQYDYVIDLQTNCKSALFSLFAKGKRYGPSPASATEYIAGWTYSRQYKVKKHQYSITRWQQILGQIFAYQAANDIQFNIQKKLLPDSKHQPDKSYLVLLTNASWETKRLSTDSWIELVKLATNKGYQVLLPWGAQNEFELASFIAEGFSNAKVLPRLSLGEIATLLIHSEGTISNDTGLAHLSAALEVPTITCYGPTDPELIAAWGKYSEKIQAADFSCMPCYKRQCIRNNQAPNQAKCLESFKAATIWEKLEKLILKKK